jgi:tetratricopeptide (TPR) repeat protein
MVDTLLQKLMTSDHAAKSLMKEKCFNEAILEWTESVRLSALIHGDDHEFTIIGMEKLGVCLTRIGRTEEALGYLRRTHQVLSARFDASSEAVAISSKHLAMCLVSARARAEAVPYLEMAIDGHIACYGPFYGPILHLQSVLVDCLASLGKTEAVAALAEQVVRSVKPSGQRHDKFLANIHRHLTRACYKLERNEQGLAVSLQSADLTRRVDGYSSFKVLEDLRFASRFLWRLERREEAVATLEKMLGLIKRLRCKSEHYRIDVARELEKRRKLLAEMQEESPALN